MTTYKLDAPDELWTEFKDTVPRSETLNERLVDMIEREVQNE